MRTLILRITIACILAASALNGVARAQTPPSLVGAMSAVALDRLASVEAAGAQLAEGDYDFKPAPGARSFGELVAHVADTNRAFCSAIAGAREPIGTEVERTVHAKAAIVTALKASTTLCQKALATLTDATLPAPRAFGGGALIDGTQIPVRDMPAGLLVMLLASHTEREYGKLTLYLRTKGQVPPTSRPRGR
ncbi:MAG: DinB family protein [Vicinamibacterales bacterium]